MRDARHCGWVHEYCVTPSYGEVRRVNKFWVAIEKLGRNIFDFGKCKLSSCLDNENCMLVQHKLGYVGIPEENKNLSVLCIKMLKTNVYW